MAETKKRKRRGRGGERGTRKGGRGSREGGEGRKGAGGRKRRMRGRRSRKRGRGGSINSNSYRSRGKDRTCASGRGSMPPHRRPGPRSGPGPC